MRRTPAQLIDEARRLALAGRYAEALPLAQQAAKIQPRSVPALRLVAAIQNDLGDPAGAARTTRRTLSIKPDDAIAWSRLGRYLRLALEYDDSRSAFDKALALAPDDGEIIGAAAEAAQFAGDHERARSLIEPAIERGQREPDLVLAHASMAKRLNQEREAVGMLRELLARDDLIPPKRHRAEHWLGTLLDALGEHEQAWEAITRAHAFSRHRWDGPAHARSIDRLIASWTREAFDAAPRAREDSPLPVFVLGMPRSGTSLVEQIIASHLSADGAGELTLVHDAAMDLGGDPFSLVSDPSALKASAVDRASRKLLRSMKKLAGDHERLVDKQPLNWAQVGLIRLIAPGAKIVHTTRDPLDTCLSCYFQSFLGPLEWSNDTTTLARYLHDYRRTMRHWTETLGIEVLEVPYERLVEDPEPHVRRLLEFVGLPWDDACLRFHESKRVSPTASNEQVRRPLYASSVGRAERYRTQLAPLVEELDRLASRS